MTTTLTKKQIAQIISDETRRRGKNGGKATLKRHGSDYFKRLSKKAIRAKLAKKKLSTAKA